MKVYEHKFMDYFLNGDRLDGIWKPDSKEINDYDNAFIKSYDEAVAWLNS